MKYANTYTASIYIGLQEGYSKEIIHSSNEVHKICQQYVDDVGLAVTITPTKFVYTQGSERGCIIGLINYPRFPSDSKQIQEKAISLGKILLEKLNQERLSIVFSDITIMLEKEDLL